MIELFIASLVGVVLGSILVSVLPDAINYSDLED